MAILHVYRISQWIRYSYMFHPWLNFNCIYLLSKCHALFAMGNKARKCSALRIFGSYIGTCSAFGVTFLMNSSISSSCLDMSIVLEKDWWSITTSVLLFFLPDRVLESWLMGVAVQPCMSCKLGLKHTTRRLKPGNRILYIATQITSWIFRS